MKKAYKISLNSLIVSLALLFAVQNTAAQSPEQIKADQKNYIWGEGSGSSLNRADQEALSMLINQISTQVESRFSILQEEVKNNKKKSFQETYQAVINTYSSATLRNTERYVLSNEPDAKIFRYIKRSDLDKIFVDRERKIKEFVRNGEHYAQRGEAAYALRYYYWALTLLRSHPDANTIALKDEAGKERLLISSLPMAINDVFSDISISVANSTQEGDMTRYVLHILYKNTPARNFDYSYWTGRDWTNTYSAKDGLGIAEFFGNADLNEIQIKAEYVFEGETSIDHELRDVMGKLDVVPFRSSYFKLPLGEIPSPPTPELAHRPVSNDSKGLSMLANAQSYEESMKSLVNALHKGDHEKIRSLFTPEAYQIYQSLLQYGQARIVREPELRFIPFEEGVMCRSLLMNFNFKNNNRSFVEEVVVYFNKKGKISNLSFGLSDIALQEIIGKDIWDERVRLILINFLENYKTAYALKRADYIESIFAEDALIIVGSVLKIQTAGDNPYRNNQIVKYNRYTKEQYIRNLRHSFASNEFINIRFEDNIIRKSGRGNEVYGIQIKQDYFSSNYGDTGYLFLLVDMSDPDQPLIHVRTWQPQKNEDGSIYGLGDF